MALKDKIFEAQIKKESVFVPQWDVTVEVRELNGGQRAKFFENVMVKDAKGNLEPKVDKMELEIVLLSCYDPETGERLFKEEDRASVAGLSGGALDLISKVGLRLSGLSDTATAEAIKN